MTKTRKLEALQSLADMQRQSALAGLAALRRKEAEALAARQDLSLRHVQALRAGCEDPQLGGIVARFEGWISQQQEAAQAKLAAITADITRQRAETARYFGRAEALRDLRAQEADRARATASKRP